MSATVDRDLVSEVVAYENGEMDDDEVLAFFQYLVDTGLWMQLQGSYGRTAHRLLMEGLLVPPWSAVEGA